MKKPSLRNLDESGATMLESAIVLPVFLAVLITGTEFLILAYTVLTAEFTVGHVLRQAVIGPHVFAAGEYADSETAYEDYIRGNIRRFASNLGVSIADDDILIDCIAPDGCGATAGVPGAMVSVTVEKDFSILRLDPIRIRSMAAGTNEHWRW